MVIPRAERRVLILPPLDRHHPPLPFVLTALVYLDKR